MERSRNGWWIKNLVEKGLLEFRKKDLDDYKKKILREKWEKKIERNRRREFYKKEGEEKIECN